MPRRAVQQGDDQLVTCPECQGACIVPDLFHPVASQTCPLCRGRGRIRPGGGNHAALARYYRQRDQAAASQPARQ